MSDDNDVGGNADGLAIHNYLNKRMNEQQFKCYRLHIYITFITFSFIQVHRS